MNTKQLTLIITLAAATTLGTLDLNAAEPGVKPTPKVCHTNAVAVTTADASLVTRKYEIAASPKVLANLPYLAGGHKTQPSKPMGACACCKP
jgi:hypothetical protein